MNNLLKCPWCGEEMAGCTVSEGSTFRWRKVDGCCTDGPEVRHDTMADDQKAAEVDSTARAIAAWNTRTQVAALLAENAELRQRAEGLPAGWHVRRSDFKHAKYASIEQYIISGPERIGGEVYLTVSGGTTSSLEAAWVELCRHVVAERLTKEKAE